MSEYQYYEFRAVDRCLSEDEIEELRAFSTRAEIDTSSFVNEYAWGSFKGDEDEWMEKYFDAFLYYANWGTHIIKLRIPSIFLDLETVQPYCNDDTFSVRLSNDKIILNFSSEDEDGGEWIEGLRLSSFLGLRSELGKGDLRCLYLGWLSNLQNYDGNALEPPLPPGLSQLSSALDHFADFLRIDPDLITAAAKTSPPLEGTAPNSKDLRGWITNLPMVEKENLLADILENSLKDDPTPATKLAHQFNKMWQSQQAGKKNGSVRQRTVKELLTEADIAAQERRFREAEEAATKQRELQRLKTLAREKRLNDITGCELLLWAQVESLASEKRGPSYKKAIELLIDLRDLAARGDRKDFLLKFEELKKRHSAKSSFGERLHYFDLGKSTTYP